MFEKTLVAQLKRIFEFDKVTFDQPSESQEQEAIFIDVKSAHSRVKDAREIAKVTGTLRVFAQLDKLPFGYFSKCIDKADPADKRGLFFFNFEENKGTYRNIVERSMEFLYLFDSQYDPALGTLTEVNLSFSES